MTKAAPWRPERLRDISGIADRFENSSPPQIARRMMGVLLWHGPVYAVAARGAVSSRIVRLQ